MKPNVIIIFTVIMGFIITFVIWCMLLFREVVEKQDEILQRIDRQEQVIRVLHAEQVSYPHLKVGA